MPRDRIVPFVGFARWFDARLSCRKKQTRSQNAFPGVDDVTLGNTRKRRVFFQPPSSRPTASLSSPKGSKFPKGVGAEIFFPRAEEGE